MLQYLIDRLCEASTWRGIVGLATAIGGAFGLTISAEVATAIITAGMAVSGALGIVLKDKLGGVK